MDGDYKSATVTKPYGNIRSGTLVNPISEKPKIGRGTEAHETKCNSDIRNGVEKWLS